jgi:4-diphosphocytidyl-2-C-methyl-D-erythritol kinase
MTTAVRSHAKINLGLAIGAPRADGFHALSTVYQTLEVHDIVTVEARLAAATALRLTSNDERVPTDGKNTAWKMVELALEALGVSAEVHIHIEKKLPVQGGMGAGSANAVAALVGLEAELGVWETVSLPVSGMDKPLVRGLAGDPARLRWWQAKRLEVAARVGSDVPLFLIGGAVLGMDRGQQVVPLPDFEPVWCTVALPTVGVSTPQAFRDWDALCFQQGLTAETSADTLNELNRAYASAFAGAIPGLEAGSSGVPSERGDRAGSVGSALVRTGILSWIENDFEQVVFRQQSSLADIKRILAAPGNPEAALHASLSGSGSALFGLYLTREAALAACVRLEAAGVASLLTRTVPRATYWRNMLTPVEFSA